MSVKHWWNDTDKGKLKCSEKNLFQCRIVYHKSHNPTINHPTHGPHFLHLAQRVSLRSSPRKLRFATRSTKWHLGGFCLSILVFPDGCNSTSILYSCICRPHAGKRPVETATGEQKLPNPLENEIDAVFYSGMRRSDVEHRV